MLHIQQRESISYWHSDSRSWSNRSSVALSIIITSKDITSNAVCKISAVLRNWAKSPKQTMLGIIRKAVRTKTKNDQRS